MQSTPIQMDPISLSRFLSTYEQLLPRVYAAAGLRDPDALMFEHLAGADCGNGLYALLGFERFQPPAADQSCDSTAFITSACLDLVDIPGEKVRGRATVCEMRLAQAAVAHRPEAIAQDLAARAPDRGVVFAAVQHTRELRALLKPVNGARGLTLRYLECLAVTEKSRRDEDGTLLLRSLFSIGGEDFTHLAIIPDGASERAVIEGLGFRKAPGKSSCWFYTVPVHPGPEAVRNVPGGNGTDTLAGVNQTTLTRPEPYVLA